MSIPSEALPALVTQMQFGGLICSGQIGYVNVAALSLSLLWAHVLLRLLVAPGPESAVNILNSEDAPVGISSSFPKSICQDWHCRGSGPNLRVVQRWSSLLH